MLDRVDYNIPHKISTSKNNLVTRVHFYHRTFLSYPLIDTWPNLGPISFIFTQFLANILPNNRFSPQSHLLAPPRLGNPGSATVVLLSLCQIQVEAGTLIKRRFTKKETTNGFVTMPRHSDCVTLSWIFDDLAKSQLHVERTMLRLRNSQCKIPAITVQTTMKNA